jgi:serine/threonine protein kinase/WD40 repeat protein/tetratricopeptide (TPR) repeat protein
MLPEGNAMGAEQPGDQTWIDEVADRFERAWGDGPRPRIEDYLADVGEPRRSRLLEELLRVERQLARAVGEHLVPEEYRRRFPAQLAVVETVFASDRTAPAGPAARRAAERPGDEAVRGLLAPEDQPRGPTVAFPSEDGLCDDDVGRIRLARNAAAEARATEAGTPAGRTAWEGDPAPTGPRPVMAGYEILGELGRGGMGVVYRATHLGLKRQVALKMILAGSHAGTAQSSRFRAEAEAVARLQHPNVVQIYDVGEQDGLAFLSLELVEGGSLAQLIGGVPQAADRSADWVYMLAQAMESAHRKGIIHRDLKPSNVLVAGDDTLKVTDFGLAKLLGADAGLTGSESILGSPSYMAPEQAEGGGKQVGPAADIYALGAILYELLTGRPPFKAEVPIETLRQVIHDEPVSPSRLRPRLPRDLETICLKCLRKEPARRYPSAAALAEDLRRFVERRPILARRSTTTEHFWRWCRRNPWLAGANIAAAALTTIVAIGSTVAAWTLRDQLITIRHSEAQAHRARTEARAQLFGALQDRARAGRYSRRMGQRFDGLDALAEAARIARELKLPAGRLDPLRDEAIACLALPDLKATGRVISRPAGVRYTAFDSTLTRYALRFGDRIEVRRVADDEEVARFIARGDRDPFVFGFSPDGRYLATADPPGYALTVWDIEKATVCLNDPGPVISYSARFSPDSRRITLAHVDGDLHVYDLATGHPSRKGRGPCPAQDLAFGPDGARIAIIYHKEQPSCRIIETASGNLVRSILLPTTAESVAWSPDGTILATPCHDLKIYLWDAATGARSAILEGSTNGGLRAAFHPAGTLLASNGWGGQMRLWDAVLGRPVLSLNAWGYFEFSRDGRIVIGLEDGWATYRVDPAAEYRTFALPSRLPTTPHPTAIHRPSIRRDGRVLAAGTDRGAVLWDIAHARELAVLPIGNASHLTFEASGDLITSGPIGVWRWPVRLDPDRDEFRIGPPRPLSLPTGFCWIDEDRTGRVLAKANHDSVSVLTPERAFRVGPLDDCRYVAVSPDGEWLATGSHGRGGAQVWRVADAALLLDLPVDSPNGVYFSPDARWLMTTAPPCRLWTVGTWREARQIGGQGHGFSPDGRLAVVMDASRVIRLVEAESGRTVARLESPDSCQVAQVAFSPDGSRLVITTHDGPAVHVWDLRAIRRHLGAMSLDWDAPAYADDDPAGPSAPPLPPLHVDLGPLARDVEHFNEAPETLLQRYTARIAAHPDDAEAHHHRGHALGGLRRLDEAIDEFTAAIRLRPDDGHFRSARGRIYEIQERYDSAITDLEVALASEADAPRARDSLVRCCNNRAWELASSPAPRLDLGRALALSRRSVDLSPGGANYGLNTMGVVQYRACLYAEAVATLERSLEAGHGQDAGYDLFFLAMAHHRLGHRDVARDYLERAIRWQGEQKSLSAENDKELSAFRAEAEAVLAGPAGELPDDVFPPPPSGG